MMIIFSKSHEKLTLRRLMNPVKKKLDLMTKSCDVMRYPKKMGWLMSQLKVLITSEYVISIFMRGE